MKTLHATREQWLSAATTLFRSWFTDLHHELPKLIRVSVGFPSRNALSERNRAIGQCWPTEASEDGSTHISVSPDPLRPDPDSISTAKCWDYFTWRLVRHRKSLSAVKRNVGFVWPNRSSIGAWDVAGCFSALDDLGYRRELAIARLMQTVQPS